MRSTLAMEVSEAVDLLRSTVVAMIVAAITTCDVNTIW